MKFYLIVNRKKLTRKNLKIIEKVETVFKEHGADYEILRTQYRGHDKELAGEISLYDEEKAIIALGGDGTLHDILNGIKSFENTALGIIPLGTGNDFAKVCRLPKNAVKCAKIILNSKPNPIDYIQLDSGVRSLNAIGMGIDVDVLKRVYSGKNTKKSKYLKGLIVSLAKFQSYNFTVRYDGKEEKHYGLIAALGNGRQIGGGIKLFPKAKIDDGYLELVIVDYISKPATVFEFVKLMLGKIHKIKKATVVKTKRAEFEYCGDGDYFIQADGELYENTPLTASIKENGLKFFTR